MEVRLNEEMREVGLSVTIFVHRYSSTTNLNRSLFFTNSDVTGDMFLILYILVYRVWYWCISSTGQTGMNAVLSTRSTTASRYWVRERVMHIAFWSHGAKHYLRIRCICIYYVHVRTYIHMHIFRM